MPMRTEAPEATATVRSWNSVSGSSASSFMARSTSRNAIDADPADDVAGDRAARAPAPVAALLGDEQQRDEPEGQGGRAPPVDPVVEAGVLQVQGARDDEQRGDADRHVHEEHPAPAVDAEDAGLAGEEPADDRAEDARGAEHREEVALVLGALPRRHDVADDGQRQREQAAGAEALDRAVERQLEHRLGQGAQHRADDEDRDRGREELLAAVDVGQLAVERRHDRRGDQVGRGGPRLLVETLEVVGDGADRRGHDGLVEGGEEHAHHQADEDRDDLSVGQGPVGPGGGGGCHVSSPGEGGRRAGTSVVGSGSVRWSAEPARGRSRSAPNRSRWPAKSLASSAVQSAISSRNHSLPLLLDAGEEGLALLAEPDDLGPAVVGVADLVDAARGRRGC